MAEDEQRLLTKRQMSAKHEYFQTDHLKSNLANLVARGGAVTIATQAIKFFLSLGSTMILARLLTPNDYGLVGMVAVITGFMTMFRDLGLSTATIQKEEINEAQISTLFWINIAFSLAIMLITIALAPAVAWFYGETRLKWITIAYALGFLFGGVTIQHEALLKRQMRFTAIAIVEITSLLLGIGTAVVLGWYGAHYWALVASQLILALTYAVGVWSLCRWRPGRPVRGSGIRPMLVIGRNITVFSIINYFARNLDNLLIGKFWGSLQLGFYSKAYQLLVLPIDQINAPIGSVAVPALSRLDGSPERYRRSYLRIVEKIAMITMPGMALMIATADWVVRIGLGAQWSAVAPILAVLGLSGLVQPVANTVGWLFISQGRTRHMLQWGLIGPTIIIVSIVAGLRWGAMGVAISYSSVLIIVVAPLLFWFAGREGPIKALDFYRTIAPAAAASVCVLGAVTLMRACAVINSPLLGLALGSVLAASVALVVLAAIPAGRKSLRDVRDTLVLLKGGH